MHSGGNRRWVPMFTGFKRLVTMVLKLSRLYYDVERLACEAVAVLSGALLSGEVPKTRASRFLCHRPRILLSAPNQKRHATRAIERFASFRTSNLIQPNNDKLLWKTTQRNIIKPCSVNF